MAMNNLKDVCRCMEVSRRWEVIARDVIRLYKSLFLSKRRDDASRMRWVKFVLMNPSPSDVSDFLRSDAFTWPYTHPSFENCLSQLMKLDNLVVDGESMTEPLIQPIIVRNAATLVRVVTYHWPFPEDEGVSYPRLKWLCCDTVTPEVISSCPRLGMLRLDLQIQQNVLQSVVNKQLLTKLQFRTHPDTPATGIREILDGLKMMTNLEIMDLYLLDPEESIDINHAWNRLFINYHSLTELSLTGHGETINFDEAVRNLVRGNPQLRIFDLNLFWVTDASLSHLAKLHHLEKLILDHCAHRIAADGVLTLIRGSSRKVISDVRISHNQFFFPVAPFHAELTLIVQETGKLLDLHSGYRVIEIG